MPKASWWHNYFIVTSVIINQKFSISPVMKRKSILLSLAIVFLFSISFFSVFSQAPYEAGDPVKPQWIFNTAKDLSLDLAGFTLIEGKTFSFRESPTNSGIKTDTYYDMTTIPSWNSSQYKQGYLFKDIGQFSVYMNYRLRFPSGYDSTYSQGYPLILFMHGAGERGNCWGNACWWNTPNWTPAVNSPAAPTNALPLSTKDGTPKLLNNDFQLTTGGQAHDNAVLRAVGKYPDDSTLVQNAWPGFIVFPQNLNGWAYNDPPQYAIRIVRLLMKKYKIDPNRVFIHGLSDGGAGVYSVIKKAPWLFAGAMPIAPINDAGIQEESTATQNWVDDIAAIPLWQFQGGVDTVASPAQNQLYINNFRDYGMSTRYTIYPTLGHPVWNNAYAEPDFFSWMRLKNKANLLVRYQKTDICPATSTGVELRLSYGFWAYQWQRNGVDIAGADSAVYIATEAGTYRARFSRVPNPTEAQWNRWSDPVIITKDNAAAPLITVVGSTQLPGKNKEDSVVLQGPPNTKYYYWYKNGKKLDFSAVKDTLAYITVTGQLGDGDYSLQVGDAVSDCMAPMSSSVSIRFNAPETIPAPDNVKGVVTSPYSINLLWRDNSNNETSFEIYRAAAKSDTYSLIAIVGENATAYLDNGLEPDSTYRYQLRAINTTATSAFTPDYVISATYIVSGLEQNSSYNSYFTVYPVPETQDNLYLKGNLSAATSSFVTIELLDVNGKIYLSDRYDVENINEGVKFDTSSAHLSSGVYMVIMKQGSVTAKRKIMIR